MTTFQVSGEINFFAGTFAGHYGLTNIRTCIHTHTHTHTLVWYIKLTPYLPTLPVVKVLFLALSFSLPTQIGYRAVSRVTQNSTLHQHA